MNARSDCGKFLVAVVLLVGGPWAVAQDGLAGALSRPNPASFLERGMRAGQVLAAADFDGDAKLDGAVLVDHDPAPLQSSWTIELHLTGRRNVVLRFESSETSLEIAALDVNRDGTYDIVVEQPLTHRLLYVWLNNGRGNFHAARAVDFQAIATASSNQLGCPWQRTDSGAACLPPERGPGGAVSPACMYLDRTFSIRKHARASAARTGPRALPIDSPRAPPSADIPARRS